MALYAEFGHRRTDVSDIDFGLGRCGAGFRFPAGNRWFDPKFGLQGLASAVEVNADGDENHPDKEQSSSNFHIPDTTGDKGKVELSGNPSHHALRPAVPSLLEAHLRRCFVGAGVEPFDHLTTGAGRAKRSNHIAGQEAGGPAGDYHFAVPPD